MSKFLSQPSHELNTFGNSVTDFQEAIRKMLQRREAAIITQNGRFEATLLTMDDGTKS